MQVWHRKDGCGSERWAGGRMRLQGVKAALGNAHERDGSKVGVCRGVENASINKKAVSLVKKIRNFPAVKKLKTLGSR